MNFYLLQLGIYFSIISTFFANIMMLYHHTPPFCGLVEGFRVSGFSAGSKAKFILRIFIIQNLEHKFWLVLWLIRANLIYFFGKFFSKRRKLCYKEFTRHHTTSHWVHIVLRIFHIVLHRLHIVLRKLHTIS